MELWLLFPKPTAWPLYIHLRVHLHSCLLYAPRHNSHWICILCPPPNSISLSLLKAPKLDTNLLLLEFDHSFQSGSYRVIIVLPLHRWPCHHHYGMILHLNSGNTVIPPKPEAEDEALLMLCSFTSFPITRVCYPPLDESSPSINDLIIVVDEVLLR